jgi:hypothetical protein
MRLVPEIAKQFPKISSTHVMSELLGPAPVERLLAAVAAVGRVTLPPRVAAETTAEPEKYVQLLGTFIVIF